MLISSFLQLSGISVLCYDGLLEKHIFLKNINTLFYRFYFAEQQHKFFDTWMTTFSTYPYFIDFLMFRVLHYAHCQGTALH